MAFPVCHLCSLVFAHSLLWTCAAAAGDCKIIVANLNNPNARHNRRVIAKRWLICWTMNSSVTRFGEFLPLWQKCQSLVQFLRVYFLFWKILGLLWQICYITGQIFIVANGQILKHNSCKTRVTRMGYFWKVRLTNYLSKVAQIFGNLKGYSENFHFLSKICCGYFLSNIWTQFDNFLFHDLVTLSTTKMFITSTSEKWLFIFGTSSWRKSFSLSAKAPVILSLSHSLSLSLSLSLSQWLH